MSSVLIKFYLTHCDTNRFYPDGGAIASVRLTPVQHDEDGNRIHDAVRAPFGPASYDEGIDLIFNNPAEAKPFIEAWRRFTESREPQAHSPIFYVRFTLAEEADAGKAEA